VILLKNELPKVGNGHKDPTEQTFNQPTGDSTLLQINTNASVVVKEMLPQERPSVTDDNEVRNLDKDRPSIKTKREVLHGEVNSHKEELTPILPTPTNEIIIQDTLDIDTDSTVIHIDSTKLTRI
jgi:hypothetical protein